MSFLSSLFGTKKIPITDTSVTSQSATRLEKLSLAHIEAFLAWQKVHARFGLDDPQNEELTSAAAALKAASAAFAAEQNMPENKLAADELRRDARAVIRDLSQKAK